MSEQSAGSVDVILLAGGRLKPRDGDDRVYKALLPMGGVPMLNLALRAFQGAAGVGRVAVVAPEVVHAAVPVEDAFYADHDTPLASLRDALAAGGSDRVLVSASDLPAITSAAVTNFLSRAPAEPIAMPVVRWQTMRQTFPEELGFFLPFREGRLSVGGMAVAPRQVLLDILPTVERLFRLRKNPLALAGALGPWVLLKLLTGRLPVAQVESRLGVLAGHPCAGVMDCAAELAFDVDTWFDYKSAQRWSERVAQTASLGGA